MQTACKPDEVYPLIRGFPKPGPASMPQPALGASSTGKVYSLTVHYVNLWRENSAFDFPTGDGLKCRQVSHLLSSLRSWLRDTQWSDGVLECWEVMVLGYGLQVTGVRVALSPHLPLSPSPPQLPAPHYSTIPVLRSRPAVITWRRSLHDPGRSRSVSDMVPHA